MLLSLENHGRPDSVVRLLELSALDGETMMARQPRDSPEVHFPVQSHQPLPLRQCHHALLHQTHTIDTVILTIETGIAVVAMTQVATVAAQTVNHATGTRTAEDTRSGTHGEAITTTMTIIMTITEEGGVMKMIDPEEKMGTIVMTMANGEGTRAAETTGMQGVTMMAMIKAKAALGLGSIMIEATVHEMIATPVSVVTSAEALHGVPRPLVAHVRNPAPARSLIHHHRLKTKPNLISPRRACSRPRRTRSSTRMERVPCSNTMNRLRLVSLLLGGGFTFSKMMSKSVRS